MRSSPETTFSETGYNLSLLRVSPGSEAAVVKSLSSAIEKHTPSAPVYILKLFGRFDLCVIYKTRNFKAGPSKGGPISGIRGGNKILAFSWVKSSEDNHLASISDGGPVWAISFFRFNEALLRKRGAKIEHAVADHWLHHQISGVKMAILGTTGWAEIVFLIRGNTFATVAKALDIISSQHISVGGESLAHIHLLPAKTLSFFGVNYSLISPANLKRLDQELKEPLNSNIVFPKLSITCPAGSMERVRRYGEKFFGPSFVSFGVADLVFAPKRGNWGNLVRQVIEMRQALPSDIYATSIGVLEKPRRRPLLSTALVKKGQYRSVTISKQTFQLIKNCGCGDDAQRRLTNLYFGLINLLQDPIIGSCFKDLLPFAQKGLPSFLREEFKPIDQDLNNLLESYIDVFQFGIEERAHGAFLSLEQLEGNLSPTKGGIQRILKAAALIPRSLSNRIKRPWNGFVVTGYYNEYFSAHGSVINFPIEYLFNPEEWAGLFHETGHVALLDKCFVEMDSPIILNALKVGLPSYPEDEYDLRRDFAFEIGSDLFGIYFCYGEDIDFYFKNVWPFLSRITGAMTKEYVIRNFLAFQFSKHFIKGKQNIFPPRISLRQEIAEFREKVKSLGLALDVPGQSTESVDSATILATQIFAPIVEYFHSRFRLGGKHKNLQAELTSKELLKHLDTVLQGTIVTDRISAPDTFLLALKKVQRETGELPLRVRIAAILSLWHSSTRFTSKG